jgi:pseudouridine-5'-monophosphatase
MITEAMNQILEEYSKLPIPPLIRAQMMGIPDSTNGNVFHKWAKLPISREQFALELSEKMRTLFPNCQPLPGAEKLLSNLKRAHCATSGDRIRLALASSTKLESYELKVSGPRTKKLLNIFQPNNRILGDDPRVPKDRAKPAPDIYLIALKSLNSAADFKEKPIMPNECLVFEDSAVGVTAGIRAGMRVVWVPHPDLAEYRKRQGFKLAMETELIQNEDGWQLGVIDDVCIEQIPSLDQFNYSKYGIVVA